MGSKGNQVATNQQQTYAPNPLIAGAGATALSKATGAANLPFQMPAAPVAGFSPFQQGAFGEILNLQNFAQPYFNTGQGYLQESAAPVTSNDVANYYNPMAANVTAQLKNIFGQQNRNVTGQLTQAAGGVGADRIAVGQSEVANQQGLAAGQTYAGLYQQALQAAEQQKQMAAGAGYGISQMGPAALAAQSNEINQLLGAGGMQQQLAQQQQNALYQQQLARIAFPYQQAQYLTGITGGLAGPMGGTTTGNATTTYPTPSPLAQGLGLGTAGIGAMGSMGMFGSAAASPIGWAPSIAMAGLPFGFKRGGALPMYDDGGSVIGDITPPMGAGMPGASYVRGSPIPAIQIQPTSPRSGPSGPWMQIKDLPMQPPGMPQNKQGTTGTAGDIAAATKFLEAIPEAEGGAVDYDDDQPQTGRGNVMLYQRSQAGTMRQLHQDANEARGGAVSPMEPYEPQATISSPLDDPNDPSYSPAGVGKPVGPERPIIDPRYYTVAQKFQQGGELGEVFEPPLAEYDPHQDRIDRSSFADRWSDNPPQPMGGGPMANTPPWVATPPTREGPQAGLSGQTIPDRAGPSWAATVPSPVSASRAITPAMANVPLPRPRPVMQPEEPPVNPFDPSTYGSSPDLSGPLQRKGSDLVAGFPSRYPANEPAPVTVAGPGAPIPKTDRLDATPAGLVPVPPGGPMGATAFAEPYPDALNRDWGQRAVRSPWMSLVKAGAQMATTVGPIGSVIGQGIKAGAGELEGQRQALQNEEAINLKAKALQDAAEYHRQVIAAGIGRAGGHYLFDRKMQAWLHLHPGDDQGAMEFANGQRTLSPAQIRVAAERASRDGVHSVEEWEKYLTTGIPPGTEAPAAPKGSLPAGMAPPRPTGASDKAVYSPSTRKWYEPDGTIVNG